MTKVVFRDRRWRRANNHLDARHCPECGATVHGNYGQSEHQQFHENLESVLGRFTEVIGLLSGQLQDAGQGIPWTAVVDGSDELEAAE
jgi:hypothetical protein